MDRKSVPADTLVSTPARTAGLELWGGIECTHNRVGENYFSQLEWTGHLQRDGDLELIANLGIRALRYPVLWEMLAPTQARPDWSFPDARLPQLRELGIRPIAGLVHHGSGPRHAPVHSSRFATGVADFAAQVAERYPWIDAYTPINEPLTTARFSALYGLWYPHGRDHRTFVRIVANECKATILAMRAIRRINPAAQLIQTDDLGKIHSTPALKYEADFQNHRRWLAWDLITGRVGTSHALWGYLTENGLTEHQLHWFQENACPPDIIGINHYPTSDRFLDENTDLYPDVIPAENSRHVYADVETVRVRGDAPGGFRARLMEAWERYGLPLAVTESHIGCTREEQIRWFAESWDAAELARSEGADVRAVTAWSLFGSFNWNSLVTRDAGYYEPGVYDIRGGEPRPTVIVSVLQTLAAGGKPDHPALSQPGWWQREERLFETHRAVTARANPRTQKKIPETRRLLILGSTGTLGRAFVAACGVRGLPFHAVTRQEINLTDPLAIESKLAEYQPWAVVNCAGSVNVDDAESDAESCFDVNSEGPLRLAEACAAQGAALLCFSSDLVFDGRQQVPYLESDATSPLNIYGRSKVAMEEGVLKAMPAALIVRTSAFFGPEDDWNFITLTLRALRKNETLRIVEDVFISPTYVPDLVRASFDLLIDSAAGIWHLVNAGGCSWAELALFAAKECGIASGRIVSCSHHEIPEPARKPAYSVLGTEKGQILPPLEVALANYARSVRL